MTTAIEFLESYEHINESYKGVVKQIDNALRLEEQEDRSLEAITAYEECVQRIDDIFAISVGLPDNINDVRTEWNDACAIIKKLKGMRVELQYRVKILSQKHIPIDTSAIAIEEDHLDNTVSTLVNDETASKRNSPLLENPPTYTDINHVRPVGLTTTSKSYQQIITGLRKAIAQKENAIQFDTLFESQVKLYKIEPHGIVAALAGDTHMSLVMCTADGEWDYLNGISFIQCCIPEESSDSESSSTTPNMIWVYPLIPTVTTCYRTEYGAFILPDLESNIPGTAFGVMIRKSVNTTTVDDVVVVEEYTDEELGDLEQFFLDLLEAVLAGKVEELKQPPTEKARLTRDTSETISKNIVGAADFIARNLVKGAEKTGEFMVKSTPYLISKMKPVSPDAPPPPVLSKLQTSVEVAKGVTSVAVSATGWIAGKVGSASMAVGRFLAPHIQTQGANLLEKSFGYDSTEANEKMEGAMTIAAGAVEGFSSVYNGLETSAKILGTNISQNSVKIIEYKYGPSAGNVAAGTFDTIGNAFNISQNVNYITPKGIAKKMVKNTGKAVVDDYKRNLRQESHVVPAGSLYPDLRFAEK